MGTGIDTGKITFTGWNAEDFDVFEVSGLEQRMEALKTKVRPKFEAIGALLQPELSVFYGEEFFTHVAKHARRTINPPNDSWVSFATNPRGYKMLPHFQVGLWSTHAFVQFAIIYECVHKKEFGEKLASNWASIKRKLPKNALWYDDHIKPQPIPHADMDTHISEFTRKLTHNKNSELLVGIEFPKNEAIKMSGPAFLEQAASIMKNLKPLYQLLGK